MIHLLQYRGSITVGRPRPGETDNKFLFCQRIKLHRESLKKLKDFSLPALCSAEGQNE
jgi:hypothetical protein